VAWHGMKIDEFSRFEKVKNSTSSGFPINKQTAMEEKPHAKFQEKKSFWIYPSTLQT
jgi:hypothetical protein